MPRRQHTGRGAAIRRAIAEDRAVKDLEREAQVLGALFDLELPCKNPQCLHELGFHKFTTPAIPSPCHFAGCTCSDFAKEAPVLNPHDPFAGLPDGDPDDPEAELLRLLEPADELMAQNEPIAPEAPQDALGGPVDASDAEEAETAVLFPVVAVGAHAVALDRLLAPAARVAEIVEALEPLLAPPLAVQQLLVLVESANAHEVTDADSYTRACQLYEQLVANEKGIQGDGSGRDGSIGALVAFFHRPWNAACRLRARYLKPVAEAKARLSEHAGTWKLEADRRAAAEAQRIADEAAVAERERLRVIAEEARKAAAALPEASPLKEMLEVTATQAQTAQQHVAPLPALVTPATPPQAGGTRGRKQRIAVLTDADAFYRALAEDSTRRVAAPIDQAYLNKQATDLGDEFAKRFPGVVAQDKGGLTAGGRR